MGGFGTTDPDAAKKFYAALFGWTTVDVPIGGGDVYAMCKLGGRDVAAIAPLTETQKKLGAPPHWTCYFTVADADAAAKKAEAAGAKIVAPPFDAMDAGRMTAVDDPTGAGVVLWQPKKHIGAGVMRVHGALAWCELLTRDVETARRVWTGVFGWTTRVLAMPNGVEYTVFEAGGAPSCGMMPMPSRVPDTVPSHWLPHFQVDDCDALVARATAAGGRALAPAMTSDVGRFATLVDPEGALFVIVQPAEA